ncbi:P-loop containing nucleoside triphosphate hydrolase protein [Trichoderma citrinoviride]|uniref:P-loop containing nucleoside triphosphate hydrolase protein n=1 Tax=Trichoderma citrinoviride TaxID=58853 RepID=A0A2T4BEQ1_9HYPO|nr:P-loop containing nucleoside triphosphate hydrolase protein [Trichoderma citrinoviride]PTB67748.1 P-loop containing nucleoside triphosphate hydrolase protein [Trichoderma citrinoviride]
MLRPSTKTGQWLLFSDIHFKHRDLDRVWKTAQWIVSEAERNRVGRAIVCGDLLTSRTMQPTHVLSTCFRFIDLLSNVVPRVHVLLGNHDLAYRREYQTTALDALNIGRLSPFVSLHSRIATHEWDGRRVLLLPFREEQGELTEAVDALDPGEARETVCFAHLAINKAITQRHIFRPDGGKLRATSSVTYRGLTGPDRFASLARTFTGHFHSHQTIFQKHFGRSKTDLQGSVTYLGSPLQLNWADLDDERRGVVLLNPETLEHELLINPHAVGYTTADLEQVLDGCIDEAAVVDKHVMLLGELTLRRYATARDRLLSFGARSVRQWSPAGFALGTERLLSSRLGASAPASDAAVQVPEVLSKDDTDSNTIRGDSSSGLVTEPPTPNLDIAAEAREFVESLQLDEFLRMRRDELVRVGQRMIQVSRGIADQNDEPEALNYRDFLDESSQAFGTRTATDLAEFTSHVFTAEPRRLTITNFLGVQGTITINFQQDFPRALTLLVGDNGSGKSTLVEAMVWCQFGRCIRSGLAVNDVVNDVVGNNCSVVLEFTNGYAIARYRKHKSHGNRVIVSMDGEPQPQLELPDARSTQAAIDELLGIDFETYIRTVVLSHESAASFLSSTPVQRRDLIETSLGLSMLDHCAQVSRVLLKDVDNEANKLERKMEGLLGKKESAQQRLKYLDQTRKQLEEKAAKLAASLAVAVQELKLLEPGADRQESAISGEHIDDEISTLKKHTQIEQEKLRRLEKTYAQVRYVLTRRQKRPRPMTWLDQLHRQMSQRAEDMAAAPLGLGKMLHASKTLLLWFQWITLRALLYVSGVRKDSYHISSAQDQHQEATIRCLCEDIQSSTARLQKLKHEVDGLLDTVFALEDRHAGTINHQLDQVIQAQKRCDILQQEVAFKQRDAATYLDLMGKEQASLDTILSEHAALDSKLQQLATHRELFAFWSSNLTKRTRRPSSSKRSTANATANFREHVLVKSLSELNALLAQVLMILYDDTRHARAMATGMLRSLFDSDTVDNIMNSSSSSGSVLDRTLSVNSSLSYGKRSGGERKRVDLALFFALLQLSWARSAHRSHYLLVDEVFDSLDEAGQAAVVRWCGLISQRMAGWILMITHNQLLIEQDPGEDAGKALVVRARMGRKGTELLVDGRRIGV